MTFQPAFYRAAAVASVLSALTTLLLIFLPELFAPVGDFEGRMQRVTEPAYRLRSWVYLLHPFLVLTAALGVAMRIRRAHPAMALCGALGFVLWAFSEAGQQTLTLFAFDRWRTAWLAGDAAMRAHLPALTVMYDGLWDAMYFLLLIGFSVGNTALSAALIRETGFTRVVGVFFFAAFALTFTIIARELSWFTLPAWLASWSYPAIQPLGRTLIGVWLWKMAEEVQPLSMTQR